MVNIFICYLNLTPAAVFGVGTYIEQLRNIFPPNKYYVYIVDTLSEDDEFYIENVKNEQTLIKFPRSKFISGINTEDNSFIQLLSLYVSDIDNSVFFFNYYYQFQLSASINRMYPSIHTIGCIHFFPWVWHTRAKEDELARCIQSDDNSDHAKLICEIYIINTSVEVLNLSRHNLLMRVV